MSKQKERQEKFLTIEETSDRPVDVFFKHIRPITNHKILREIPFKTKKTTRKADGFIKEFNLIIEFDETKGHTTKKAMAADKAREEEIKECYPDVIFFRVTEEDWYNKNDDVLVKFSKLTDGKTIETKETRLQRDIEFWWGHSQGMNIRLLPYQVLICIGQPAFIIDHRHISDYGWGLMSLINNYIIKHKIAKVPFGIKDGDYPSFFTEELKKLTRDRIAFMNVYQSGHSHLGDYTTVEHNTKRNYDLVYDTNEGRAYGLKHVDLSKDPHALLAEMMPWS